MSFGGERGEEEGGRAKPKYSVQIRDHTTTIEAVIDYFRPTFSQFERNIGHFEALGMKYVKLTMYIIID